MEPVYRLESVRHRYGEKAALEIPFLSLPGGRLYLLSGPNGAGKSTLLSILAFLLPPSEGRLFYRGERTDAGTAVSVRARREVTLLHQSPYLFDDTVFGNIAFGLVLRGVRGTELRRKVLRALDAVGLPGFGQRHARRLSGGEAQRVAVARALALSPRVLLLDEPMAGIDRETGDLLQEVIAVLLRDGTTVMMATHENAVPERPGCKILRIEHGRVRESPHPMPDPENPMTRIVT